MGFFDDVKRWTQERASELQAGVKKIKNKDFMEAVTAGCAMVAFADGLVSPDEKAKMAGFIQRNDALKVFDMQKVAESFDKYVKGFEFDYAIGKGEALKAIAKVKKNADEARLLVRVCCAIGAADNDFDEHEKKVVVDICKELELDPEEFGLSASGAAAPPSSPPPPSPPAGNKEKISTKDTPDDGIPDWMRR